MTFAQAASTAKARARIAARAKAERRDRALVEALRNAGPEPVSDAEAAAVEERLASTLGD